VYIVNSQKSFSNKTATFIQAQIGDYCLGFNSQFYPFSCTFMWSLTEKAVKLCIS